MGQHSQYEMLSRARIASGALPWLGHAVRQADAVEPVFTTVSLNVGAGARREKIQGDKFPVPKVRDLRQLDWPTDEEFGRQMLAGALTHALKCSRLPPLVRIMRSLRSVYMISDSARCYVQHMQRVFSDDAGCMTSWQSASCKA